MRHKLAHGTALDMALVIPGFARRFDLDDLIRCTAPRKLFLVSSDGDPYAADAADLVANGQPVFQSAGVSNNLRHLRVGTGHALDPKRFAAIAEWLIHEATASD